MLQISVIMPVYNETLTELKQSIESIRYQTFNDFEFIIVDDNPKSLYIKKFLLTEERKDKRIKLIFNQCNLGSMLSANKAIKVAKGKFIARMDADDIAVSTRLQCQLDFCIKYNLDFTCCNLLNFYTNKEGNKIYNNKSLPDITQVNFYKIKRTLSHINIAIGPTLFFNRQISKDIGMYRPIVCEDYDLAVRFLINHDSVGYLSKTLVYKRDRLRSISTLNLLQEFITWHSISKYIRKYNYNKVISLSILKKAVNNLSNKNILRYKKFKNSSDNYKKYKSFKFLFYKYLYVCSSLFMFKWAFFTHFTYLIQYLLLK